MTKQFCEHCNTDAKILNAKQINEKIKNLTDWHYSTERLCLYKKYQFKGFYKTMAFVNAVAWVAHQQQHHPDLHVSYNTVIVHFQSHAAGGVTENDFICAHHVDDLGD